MGRRFRKALSTVPTTWRVSNSIALITAVLHDDKKERGWVSKEKGLVCSRLANTGPHPVQSCSKEGLGLPLQSRELDPSLLLLQVSPLSLSWKGLGRGG